MYVSQVASQFNCLEMATPTNTPEDGIGIYEFDMTQVGAWVRVWVCMRVGAWVGAWVRVWVCMWMGACVRVCGCVCG